MYPPIKKPSSGSSAFNVIKAIGLGLFATLCAAPSIAGIAIPTAPLQTGSRVPPNVLFILDDSGSMANTYMPAPGAASDAAPTTNAPNIGPQTYARNGVYYNPANTYFPWKDANGAYIADTPYTAAYSSTTLASGGTTNLSTSVQTYYVPKAGMTTTAQLMEPVNYWRYQILTDGRVMRAERLNYTAPPPVNISVGTTGAVTNGNFSTIYTFVVPPSTTSLVVTTSGGTGTSANLYLRYNATPTTGTYDCRSQNAGNTETCTVNNPATGTWRVGVYANGSNFSGVIINAAYIQGDLASDGCDITTTGAGWRDCTQVTPTGRTEAAEQQNYATWYSFHRTRSKIAKAGASYAFSDLGTNLRVGFNSIWGRDTYNIPVGTDGGLFRDLTSPTATSNRSTWFSKLYAATASGSTPLKGALQTAGEYFQGNASTGPYGPETAATQLTCRQNFTILTTDGFWNNNNAYDNPVGNADNTTTTAVPLPVGASGTAIGYTAARPYSDGYSDTLADVANYYWKTDLRTDLGNIVPTTTDDPAYWQHMTTFSLSIGLQGTLNPATDLPGLTSGSISWPDPTPTENSTRIDDLWHAAVNGHGDFVAATDPGAFADGLRGALAAIVARTGSNSNVSANSFSLNSNTRIYLASYVSGQWTGELKAYPITSAGVGTTASWSAAALIPAYASRTQIYTWNGTAGATFPTAAQTTALTASVANYIKGDRSNEQQNNPPGTPGVFRDRISILGDIINSSPAYVQDTDTIYVGANDGMLHAFNAVNGVEQFAYVPNGLNFTDLKSLSYLTAPAYDHRYFVDGPVVVSTRAQTPSNNYLVGALGRGGKGVFGLNVTNPASFSASNVLWEQAGDADMGQVISRPVIVKLNNGVNGVLVSNGLNSTNDGAALFVLNLTTGAVIKKIVPTGATGNNGLAAPRGWDADGNGTVDYVYAGDLLGNLWKFDLTSSTTASWGVSNSGSPMFIAKDSLGNRQPITGSPTVALEPNTFETWVFFGTGRYLEAGDPASLAVQSWYGLRDDGVVINSNRSTLKERKIVALGTVSGKLVRGFEAAVAGDMAGKTGWYIDLLTPPNPPSTAVGERMIGDPFVSSGTLFASSIIPSSDPFASGGSGFVNAVDAFTGSSGFAGAEAAFDLNGNGDFTDDVVPNGAGTLPVGSVDLGIFMPSNPSVISEILVAGGSLGTTATVRVNNPSNSGRISWREIIGD